MQMHTDGMSILEAVFGHDVGTEALSESDVLGSELRQMKFVLASFAIILGRWLAAIVVAAGGEAVVSVFFLGATVLLPGPVGAVESVDARDGCCWRVEVGDCVCVWVSVHRTQVA